jgi:hypothetical protein
MPAASAARLAGHVVALFPAARRFAFRKKNKGRHHCRPLLAFGARSWTRTNDPLINSSLLNQYVTESLAKLGEGWGS